VECEPNSDLRAVVNEAADERRRNDIEGSLSRG
jgi:hypothetical protein